MCHHVRRLAMPLFATAALLLSTGTALATDPVWEAISVASPPWGSNGVKNFASDGPRLFVSDFEGSLFVSADDGATWTKEKGLRSPIESLVPCVAGVIASFSDGTVKKRGGDGKWQKSPVPKLKGFWRVRSDGHAVLATNDQAAKMAFSADGITWTKPFAASERERAAAVPTADGAYLCRDGKLDLGGFLGEHGWVWEPPGWDGRCSGVAAYDGTLAVVDLDDVTIHPPQTQPTQPSWKGTLQQAGLATDLWSAGGLLVLTGSGGGVLGASDDGIHWRPLASPGTTRGMKKYAVRAPDLFAIAGPDLYILRVTR